MSTVKIEGLRELEQALAALPKATARNTLRRVLKKGAEHVRDTWAPLAPQLTRHLEHSIIVGPSSKLTSRQKRDAKKEGTYFAEMHVGTSDPAGQQQEFGNINHPAQPSGRPAWEATQESVLQEIGKDLKVEIEKSAARVAKKAAKLAGGV